MFRSIDATARDLKAIIPSAPFARAGSIKCGQIDSLSRWGEECHNEGKGSYNEGKGNYNEGKGSYNEG